MGASGPGPSIPGPQGRRGRPVFCGAAPGLLCSRPPASAALSGCCRGILPCAPPVPAAPAGGSGDAQGCSSGLRPPRRGRGPPWSVLPGGCPCTGAVKAEPCEVAGFASLDGSGGGWASRGKPGIDKIEHLCYNPLAGLDPGRIRAPSRKGCPRARQKTSPVTEGFSFCHLAGHLSGTFPGSLRPGLRRRPLRCNGFFPVNNP